jgi:hypothetical protein
MRHLLAILLMLSAIRLDGQCTADYETIADSTVANVAFLQGLVDRWCFPNSCDSSLRYGEIIVRGKSPSFHNTIVLHGFMGKVSIVVMDTTCGVAVFDTCWSEIGMHEDVALTFGRNFCIGITAHNQQLPTPQVYVLSVPTAQPPPYVEGCPVGLPEMLSPRPRKAMGTGYTDMLGRWWPTVPDFNTILYDHRKGVRVVALD